MAIDIKNNPGEHEIRPCKGLRGESRGEPRVHPAYSDSHVETRIKTAATVLLMIFLISVTQNGCLFKKKAKYNPEGFQNAVTLKKESLELMAKAGESYFVHRQEVYELMSAVEKAYEAARKKKKNDSVIAAWNVMRDPKQNRLGGFMEKWRIEDKIDSETIQTMVEWVGKDFDILIKIEEEKKK